MTHISFRISDDEKMDYAVLPMFEKKTLTKIIKDHLNHLVRKHTTQKKK